MKTFKETGLIPTVGMIVQSKHDNQAVILDIVEYKRSLGIDKRVCILRNTNKKTTDWLKA